jgi:hypothetical protein
LFSKILYAFLSRTSSMSHIWWRMQVMVCLVYVVVQAKPQEPEWHSTDG